MNLRLFAFLIVCAFNSFVFSSDISRIKEENIKKARQHFADKKYNSAIKYYLLISKSHSINPLLKLECYENISECLYRLALNQKDESLRSRLMKEASRYGNKEAIKYIRDLEPLIKIDAWNEDLAKKKLDEGYNFFLKGKYVEAIIAYREGWMLLYGTNSSLLNRFECALKDLERKVNKHKSGSNIVKEKNVILPGGEKMTFVWCHPGEMQYKDSIIKFDRGFWIGKYEVTQAQWVSVIKNNPFDGYMPNIPAIGLNYDDWILFLSEVSKNSDYILQMPNENQWVYASTCGGQMNINAYELHDYAWYKHNSGNKMHQVGLKKPTFWGAYDMLGNVWEWCSDDFVDTPIPVYNMKGERLSNAEAEELNKAISSFYGNDKVAKGGSFFESENKCTIENKIGSRVEFFGRIGTRMILVEKNEHNKLLWKDTKQDDIFTNPFDAIKKLQVASAENSLTLNEMPNSAFDNKFHSWQIDIDILKNDQNYVLELHKIVEIYNSILDLRKTICNIGESLQSLNCDPNKDDDFQDLITFCNKIFSDRQMWLKVLHAEQSKRYNEIKGILSLVKFNMGSSQVCLLKNKLRRKYKEFEEREALDEIIRNSSDVKDKFKAIVKKYKDNFVIIHAGESKGSGFIIKESGKYYMYTNKHVMEGGSPLKAYLGNGERLRFDRFEISAFGYDLARCRITNPQIIGNDILSISSEEVNLGDDICIIGNSDGIDVQTFIQGEIVGIGVGGRILETNAQFVHGNSGSPMINAKGEVVGIASFAVKLNDKNDWLKANTRFSEARRFGIRIYNYDDWKRKDWNQFIKSQSYK